jgi:6-phosphogluconolactonase
MRMKFNKSSQLLLVSAVCLMAAGLITACGTDTVDFVYVASAKAAGPNNYGEIDVFEINRVSGAMRQIPSSPFPSGGRNPVAEAVSPDYANLYVVNEDDNTIVQFMIGNDGKLYPQNTVNTPGIYPLAEAVSGSYLFVADTYQPLPTCSTADPCSGSVAVFPLLPATTGSNPTPSGAPGTPITNTSIGASYWPLTLSGAHSSDIILPTAVTVRTWTLGAETASYLYVTAYDTTSGTGYVYGFRINSDGTLTALASSPYAAGTHPSAIAGQTVSTTSSGLTTVTQYTYITDSASGNIIGFRSASTTDSNSNTIPTGVLTSLSGSPFPAGNQPSAITVDSVYPYAYVANALDGNVEAYSISSGALHYLGGSVSPVTYAAGIQPAAMGIDPSTNHFVFTVNFTPGGVSGTISDFELNATSGTLIDTQGSPYSSNAQPTAVAAVPHGSAH